MSETELQTLTSRLDRIEMATRIGTKDILRIEEAAMLTGFSIGHLYNLTSKRAIPYYKQGQAVFFRKSELEAWMTETRIATDHEIDVAATTHTTIHKLKK